MASPLGIIDLLFALVFTAFVLFQGMFVLRDDERVFRSLHAYETFDGEISHSPPSSFSSVDWANHPKHESHKNRLFSATMPTQHNTCYSKSAKASCGPEFWQSAAFCPPKSGYGATATDWRARLTTELSTTSGFSKVTKSLVDRITSQLMTPEGDEHHMSLTKGVNPGMAHLGLHHPMYYWRNPNMADVCRIERLGSMGVFIANDSVWAFSGAHSISVLLLAAALVMWLANITDVIGNPKTDKTAGWSTAARAIRGSKWVMLGFALAVIFAARWLSKTELVLRSDVVTRVLPNGSYYYGLVFVFWAGYLLVKKTAGLEGENETEAETAEVVHKTEYEPADAQPAFTRHGQIHSGYSVVQVHHSQASMLLPQEMHNTHMNAAQSGELNVSGFMNNPKASMKLDAYLPHAAAPFHQGGEQETMLEHEYNPDARLTYQTFRLASFDLESSHFCVAQAFSLPLLTLAVFVFNTNYEIDSNLQVLWWAVSAYGLLDVVVYRLGRVLEVYEVLINSHSRHSNTEAMETVGLGRLIDVVAMVLQLFIALIACFCMRWHLSLGARELVPIIGAASVSESFLDFTPLLFILYYIVCTIVKICSLCCLPDVLASNTDTRVGRAQSVLKRFGNNSQHVLFVTLNVFVAVVMLMLTLEMRKKSYTSPFEELSDTTVKAEVSMLMHEYRSGWTSLVHDLK